MHKRPASVVLIACLYIVAGFVGFVYHFREMLSLPVRYDVVWVEFVRLLAVVSGVFLLQRQNWARWLALAWILLHVVVSAFHNGAEFAMHLGVFALVAWSLFRPSVAHHFITERYSTQGPTSCL